MSFLLEGLGSELITSLAESAGLRLPYIIHGVHAGLSANQIQKGLTAAGIGMRRSPLLSLIKGVRNSVLGAEYQRGLKFNELPSPTAFTGSQGFLKHRYAYVVRVHGRNPITGERGSQHITISTPTVLTNTSIERYVGDIMDAGFTDYHLAMDGYSLESVLVDPRFLP